MLRAFWVVWVLLSLAACGAADPATSDASDAALAGPDAGPVAWIRPGVGVGSLTLGLTFAQVRAAMGEPTGPAAFDRIGFASYPELGIELVLASSDIASITDDALVIAIGARAVDGADRVGAVLPGSSRDQLIAALGEPHETIGPIDYYAEGVAVEYDDAGVAQVVAVYPVYDVAVAPPPMQSATGCAADGYAPVTPPADPKVIDMHLHGGQWGHQPQSAHAFITGAQPAPFRIYGPGLTNALQDPYAAHIGSGAQLDWAGVDRGVLYATYTHHTVGYLTNRKLCALLSDPRNDGRFVGFPSINLDDFADAEVRASRVAALASYFEQYPELFVGIKLAHAHQGVALDDVVLDDVYDVAATYGVPVLLHTGFSPFPGSQTEPNYYDPAGLTAIVEAHSDVVFILAHIGQGDARAIAHALDLAESHDNVWLGLSALGGPLRIDANGKSVEATAPQYPEVLAAIAERGLAGRTVFGSDGPQFSGTIRRYVGELRDAMVVAGFADEEIEAMMATNFASLLPAP